MHSIPSPLALEGVFHYQQPAGKQPPSFILPLYSEMVELITAGHAWIRDGEDWRELLPGDLLWHSPGDTTIDRSDPENPYRCMAVRFRVLRAEGMGVRRFSKWPDVEEINLLTNEVTRLVWDETFNQDALRDYLFGRLIYQINLYERSLRMARYPAPIAAAITRIESDFSKPLRLSDLAQSAGWSAPHLHAEFRKHLKMTPHQMLLQKRLRVAKQRLISTGAPIKQIATDCGFADLTTFAHIFKSHMGQTPTQFRIYHTHMED